MFFDWVPWLANLNKTNPRHERITGIKQKDLLTWKKKKN